MPTSPSPTLRVWSTVPEPPSATAPLPFCICRSTGGMSVVRTCTGSMPGISEGADTLVVLALP